MLHSCRPHKSGMQPSLVERHAAQLSHSRYSVEISYPLIQVGGSGVVPSLEGVIPTLPQLFNMLFRRALGRSRRSSPCTCITATNMTHSVPLDWECQPPVLLDIVSEQALHSLTFSSL